MEIIPLPLFYYSQDDHSEGDSKKTFLNGENIMNI